MSLLRIAPNGVLRLKFILVFQNCAEGTQRYVALGRNVFLLLSWWQALYLVDNFQLSLDGKGLVLCSLHPQLASADLLASSRTYYYCTHAYTRLKLVFPLILVYSPTCASNYVMRSVRIFCIVCTWGHRFSPKYQKIRGMRIRIMWTTL